MAGSNYVPFMLLFMLGLDVNFCRINVLTSFKSQVAYMIQPSAGLSSSQEHGGEIKRRNRGFVVAQRGVLNLLPKIKIDRTRPEKTQPIWKFGPDFKWGQMILFIEASLRKAFALNISVMVCSSQHLGQLIENKKIIQPEFVIKETSLTLSGEGFKRCQLLLSTSFKRAVTVLFRVFP